MSFLDPVKGFGVTFSTMFKPVVTEDYPKNPEQPAKRYHGRHQLNRHPDGLEKCVGCELCAWACPADAIFVEGGDNTDEERYSPGERYGKNYQINYLRCIGCGLCIEACPTRSLTMTNEYELADDDRQRLIYTKDMLLAPLLPGMEQPPHPMRLGDEHDYYANGPELLRRAPAGQHSSETPRRRSPPRPRTSAPRVRWRARQVARDRRTGGRDHGRHRRRLDRLLDPGPARPAGRGRHGVLQGRGALRAVAGAHHAVPWLPVHRPGRRVPRLRADHRLHRRDHDAVPVRADADRPGCRRLDLRGAQEATHHRHRARHRVRDLAGHRTAAGAGGGAVRRAGRMRWPTAARSGRSPSCCSPTTCSRSS